MAKKIHNPPLKKHTTFRIGGKPRLYVRPADKQQLRQALETIRDRSISFRVLGGGSNLLIDDGPLPFAVLHMCSPGFSWVKRSGKNTLRVGAGVRLGKLLSSAQKDSLGGLEFLAGIPGTLGGAIAGNAGAWGSDISERISRVWAMTPDGECQELSPSEMNFGYRTCDVRDFIITEAELELEPRSPELIARAVAQNAQKKGKRHPTGNPSAGCVFKNPPTRSAGKLIDLCGLKGSRVGGAEISPVHANFICNMAQASSRDVIQLIETVKNTVRESFGVELELELKHWPSHSKVA